MLRSLTKFDYLLKETWLGLKRGGWMNWAAISTVTVLLLLLGLSVQTSWQVEGLLTQFGSQLEVTAFLDTGIQANDLKATVAKLPEVAQVTPLSKEQAWGKLVKELGLEGSNANKQLEGNPLVDELTVRARSAAAVPQLAQKLKALNGVDEVQYGADAVKQVGELSKGLTWVGSAVITLLTLTAMAVISTTIRLIVLARRREIEVMQLVGATATWIYLPFLVQGLFFGLVGAGVAYGLIRGLQQSVADLVAKQPEFVQFLSSGASLSPTRLWLLPLILLTFGSGVGLVGSWFAVRRIAPR
jgi:cell division transport system permease protein